MNKKILSVLIFGIFIFSIANISATDCNSNLGTFKLGDKIDLIQQCPSCTYVNISSINYPNGTTQIINLEMGKTAGIYNYSFTPSTVGEYQYFVTGDKNAGISGESICFDVNLNGNVLKTGQSILYFVLLIALMIFFIITTYAFVKIPFRNSRNDEGKIISINDLKYLKGLLFFLSYGMLVWISNIMIEISSSLLNSSTAFSFFKMLFSVMTGALYPIMILTIISMIIMWINDSKLKKWLERGF